jgi:hypothetical protein
MSSNPYDQACRYLARLDPLGFLHRTFSPVMQNGGEPATIEHWEDVD